MQLPPFVMKKITILFLLFISSHSYSQELMNFYIEPSGDDEVTLETLVYRSATSSFGGSTINYLDNTITVSLCYFNTPFQSITVDPQAHIINLPTGYSTYTINIEIFGDIDVFPCSFTNLVDTGTITFDYPYNPIETTYIPDNIFEDYLEYLGFGDDIPNNDLVFTHRIINTQNLFLNHQGIIPISGEIVNMEGLQVFTKLKELRVDHNLITNLDVSSNILLEKFSCNDNPLNTIDLSNNLVLKELRTSFTIIANIDVTANTLLEKLDTRNSLMEDIDISQNILLTFLDMSYNQISELDVSNNHNLEIIYFNYNQLSELNVSNNHNLSGLYCNDNQLSSLNANGLENLRYVKLNNNQITTLNLSSSPELEKLYVYNNDLTSLNLKSGNNANLLEFLAIGNDNLYCIDVDNPEEAPYPGWFVDNWTSFSEDCSLGIEDVLATQIMLYPNPVQNVLNLENSSGYHINSFKVYDVMGRMVFNLDSLTHPLDVSNLEAGLFFISITTANGNLIKRFVKE